MPERAGIVRVIGLGSPFGDDRIGWQVADRLAESGLPAGVEAVRCGVPGRDLLPLLDGLSRAILVDAVRGEGRPGDIVRCSPADLAGVPDGGSTHGFGVAAALDLAAAMGCLPPRLEIIGIEAGDGDAAPAMEIAGAVSAAGERLVEMLRAEFAGGPVNVGAPSATRNARLEETA